MSTSVRRANCHATQLHDSTQAVMLPRYHPCCMNSIRLSASCDIPIARCPMWHYGYRAMVNPHARVPYDYMHALGVEWCCTTMPNHGPQPHRHHPSSLPQSESKRKRWLELALPCPSSPLPLLLSLPPTPYSCYLPHTASLIPLTPYPLPCTPYPVPPTLYPLPVLSPPRPIPTPSYPYPQPTLQDIILRYNNGGIVGEVLRLGCREVP